MIVKYQALAQSLRQPLRPVYILTGQDAYLLNDAARLIKAAWRQCGEYDERVIDLNTPADWDLLQSEAQSYSLFSDLVLLDARCEKKSIDAMGKKILQQYIQQSNPRCLIILRAPHVPNKLLQTLANNDQTVLMQAYPMPPAELLRWITHEFKNKQMSITPEIPALVHQYTQGNMLACAQLIEKLALITPDNTPLTIEQVKEQLYDQCDYQLYELADACLNGRAEKAIHLLRQACQNKTEPTLMLWLLTQEIRLLVQLDFLRKQSVPLTTACSQLKIWPQRASSYETTRIRVSGLKLQVLLKSCQQLDEQIKSSVSRFIWHGLEMLVLGLCIKTA